MSKLENFDKRLLNMLVIIFLSFISFEWSFWIFKESFLWSVFAVVIVVRILSSYFIYMDYSLSWSRSSGKSFLIKSFVYVVALVVYSIIFYNRNLLPLFITEFFVYLFMINFSMYCYNYFSNINNEKKRSVAIYGASNSGILLANEFGVSKYDFRCFVDDKRKLQERSIDGKKIISQENFKELYSYHKVDLFVIAVPNANNRRIKEIYENMHNFAHTIKILPSIDDILQYKPILTQLQSVSIESLLARHPKGLNRVKIAEFIKDKIVMITGAGGNIGKELSRQCAKYGAGKLILIDNCEYNLDQIGEELKNHHLVIKMVNVVNKKLLNSIFVKYKPQIVIHTASYKSVSMVEKNIFQGIQNNIIGTKICIDLSVMYEVEKFILISTDKAMKPTSVVGATKRVCEIYAQNRVRNIKNHKTKIVTVQFSNLLGSDENIIQKLKQQIENGGSITINHPDIAKYFMLISEACELILQITSMAKGEEILILDMGEPIKIVDVAKKLIEVSGAKNINIEFSNLQKEDKLYEELLMNDSNILTNDEGIKMVKDIRYDIEKLNQNIKELIELKDDKERLIKLKSIIPEFNHKKD